MKAMKKIVNMTKMAKAKANPINPRNGKAKSAKPESVKLKAKANPVNQKSGKTVSKAKKAISPENNPLTQNSSMRFDSAKMQMPKSPTKKK